MGKSCENLMNTTGIQETIQEGAEPPEACLMRSPNMHDTYEDAISNCQTTYTALDAIEKRMFRLLTKLLLSSSNKPRCV